MILNILLTVAVLMCAGCGCKPLEEMHLKSFQNTYNEVITPKYTPEAYRPASFDVGQNDQDLEQKRDELIKFRSYNLISEEEFQEKLIQLN